VGRSYRLHAHGNFGSAAVGNRAGADLNIGGTRYVSYIMGSDGATLGASSVAGDPDVTLSCVASPSAELEISAGAKTVDFICNPIGGVQWQLNAAAGSSAFLEIFDEGPSI
jgi:hypothetical protein